MKRDFERRGIRLRVMVGSKPIPGDSVYFSSIILCGPAVPAALAAKNQVDEFRHLASGAHDQRVRCSRLFLRLLRGLSRHSSK